MGERSKIQWTDASWNPWHGCKKVSPGCKYCYMFRDKERYGHNPTDVLRSKTKFDDPLKWAKTLRENAFSGKVLTGSDHPFLGMKIFTCSWSDFFIEDADEWRPEAWKIIKDTPEFTYQILTKRTERIAECLPEDWEEGYENVWLGVSVESVNELYRMGQLAVIPSKIRFASMEPLISQIPLYGVRESYYGVATTMGFFDWVIIGGESGNESGKYKYRPCSLYWIESLVGECKNMGVPVFVKQLGTHLAKELGLKDRHGGDMSEWPEHLQIREFPNQ